MKPNRLDWLWTTLRLHATVVGMRRFPPSPITSLIDEAALYNLGESFCSHLAVHELLAGDGAARLAQLALGYGTSAGDAELRRLVAANLGVRADEVLVTPGAVSALFLLGLIVADVDAEIVVALPCFPPFLATLHGIGANVVTEQLRFEHSYRLDAAVLEGKLSAKTRLVALASPQNPSGVAISRREIEQVLNSMTRICPAALLLIDEIYREAVHGAHPASPSFASLSPQVVTCGSLSKSHGAPGLRIGWMTVRVPELREQLRLAKFSTSISCGTVDEFLATELLRQAETVLAPRRAFMADALKVVEEWVDANREQIRWVRPDAGAFCCIQLNPAVFDRNGVQRFHSWLAQARILVAAGEWFGDTRNVFRLGFGYEPIEKLRTGLELLSDALKHASRPATASAVRGI